MRMDRLDCSPSERVCEREGFLAAMFRCVHAACAAEADRRQRAVVSGH